MEITAQEQLWLASQRLTNRRAFVGIDHHTAQLTVAVASGETLRQRPAPASIPTQRFSQDGLGYRDFLAYLTERFPEAEPQDFFFLAEPSYAQPLCHFLAAAGFPAEQILWVKTTKVPQYRKAHDVSRRGKNDDEDARTLLLMLFDGISEPSSRLHLFRAVTRDPLHETLRHLAAEHERLTGQSVQVQNKIFQIVIRLFPEIRYVYRRQEQRQKPDGTRYEVQIVDLFQSATPMKILAQFPTPKALATAGWIQVWNQVGKPGGRKAKVRQLVELAAVSAGVPDDLAAHRLVLLIEEYHQLQARLQQYEATMAATIEPEPILASFLQVQALSVVMIARLVGAMGDLQRFQTFDALKSYMNLAPKPLPQTGTVDEQGRLVQVWRMPANTYKVVNGQRRLVYAIPGQQAPRKAAWLWFELLVRGSTRCPSDPFVQLYQRYKAKHQGHKRWLGRVRWKVVGKLVKMMYVCLKQQTPYDPRQVCNALAS